MSTLTPLFTLSKGNSKYRANNIKLDIVAERKSLSRKLADTPRIVYAFPIILLQTLDRALSFRQHDVLGTSGPAFSREQPKCARRTLSSSEVMHSPA